MEYNIINNDNFSQHLGIEFIDAKNGVGKAILPVKPHFYNPIKSIHGGVLFTLADVVSGTVANSYGKRATTLSSTFNYLAPAMNVDYLVGVAKEVKRGKTISVYDVEIFDNREKLVASGTFTFFILEKVV